MIVYVYVLEKKETYKFKANKEYDVFSPVEFVGLDGTKLHGIVVEEEFALNLHDKEAKVAL